MYDEIVGLLFICLFVVFVVLYPLYVVVCLSELYGFLDYCRSMIVVSTVCMIVVLSNPSAISVEAREGPVEAPTVQSVVRTTDGGSM